MSIAREAEKRYAAQKKAVLQNPDNVDDWIHHAQRQMSNSAGALRRRESMQQLLEETASLLEALPQTVGVGGEARLYRYYKLRDILITQQAVLTAMIHHSTQAKVTCGSALYYSEAGQKPEPLEELFRFLPDDGTMAGVIQETVKEQGGFVCRHRPVRPIPENNDFFETTWRTYRENGNVY
jgi:hypothetical protein